MGLKPSKESALVCFAGTIGATGCTVCLFYPGYFSIMEESIREFIPDFTMTMTSSFKYNGWFVLWSVLLIFIMMKIYRIRNEKINIRKEYFEEQYAAPWADQHKGEKGNRPDCTSSGLSDDLPFLRVVGSIWLYGGAVRYVRPGDPFGGRKHTEAAELLPPCSLLRHVWESVR